jgi:superfamily II DNA/RNA helicase
MPESTEAIEAAIRDAISPGFRDRLLDRGEARGMIWRDGIVPENGPDFSYLLSYDLLSYGYALLANGLRLVEAGGSRDLSQSAFAHSATAIEAVIARGPASDDRGFHRVVAAAAYHLGSFSARAYSALNMARNSAENTTSEQCLILLMLRDLNGLSHLISNHQAEAEASDVQLLTLLQSLLEPGDGDESGNDEDAPDVIDVVDLALADAFIGSISAAMLAFERGESELLESALDQLRTGLNAAGELNMVPQWWCHRLAIHLLDGLWQASFHTVLPVGPKGGDGGSWKRLRATFIASLFRRPRSEIDLWPSQLEAAARVLDTNDNLVLSLPTSAGKTRIAELCILATLAEKKRVVFVTPLRALSAQTEAALERTFVPLGKTVSSLYGAIGVSDVDQHLLRDRDIVVATPEKLDFALRNDPALLDDVGLVVLDEGHMIGEGEREVRYEIQVQRLLRRSDAASRRIICLSAILPEGEEVQDFVDWLTADQPDGLIASSWRPTKLLYGDVIWQNGSALLNVTVGDEAPFVPKFLTASQPSSKKRKKPVPNNQIELSLAAAWRLVDDGQTVLIYCPQKNSVNAFAEAIIKLHRQGALQDIFESDPDLLSTALAIGKEWFAPDHDILACLKLGIAIHHGSLPSPYRKEVERLLQQGVLKVTVSSPTLAQGLNLSASALIVHSIWRNGKVIATSEFRNIAGRAGRAFVDSSGLVLHPIFEKIARKRRMWRDLVDNAALHDTRSGFMRLVAILLSRMQSKLGVEDLDTLIEYVAGSAAWTFPELSSETESEAAVSQRDWRRRLASLDCALLSLIDDPTVEEDDIEAALDDALGSSLWTRSVARQFDDAERSALHAGLVSRARILWNQSTPTQRRGYFLAGVGLETGRLLDEHAQTLNHHLRNADQSILIGDHNEAIAAIVAFASIALAIEPFAPPSLPDSWEGILSGWLQGTAVAEIGSGDPDETLEFIEGTLIYRLPWALEAVRVRAAAHDTAGSLALITPDQGHAVAAVEAGTLNRSAALLMQAGFSSRSGALAAVQSEYGQFTTLAELHQWLNSAAVRQRAIDDDWPTPSAHDLWIGFVNRSVATPQRTWTRTVENATVTWFDGHEPNVGDPYRAVSLTNGETVLETAQGQQAGTLNVPLNPVRLGLLAVTASPAAQGVVELSYHGPADLRRQEPDES